MIITQENNYVPFLFSLVAVDTSSFPISPPHRVAVITPCHMAPAAHSAAGGESLCVLPKGFFYHFS